MRLLVCGSRHWTDYATICRELRALDPATVIHGDANGADRLAERWAIEEASGVLVHRFPADWERDGRAAGPTRNARMLREGEPDRGLAFGPLYRYGVPKLIPGGHFKNTFRTTGTGDMVSKLLRARVPVRWVSAPGQVAIDLVEMPGVPR